MREPASSDSPELTSQSPARATCHHSTACTRYRQRAFWACLQRTIITRIELCHALKLCQKPSLPTAGSGRCASVGAHLLQLRLIAVPLRLSQPRIRMQMQLPLCKFTPPQDTLSKTESEEDDVPVVAVRRLHGNQRLSILCQPSRRRHRSHRSCRLSTHS